jgi:predicted DNA-binding antitoxin AbrB/MazE fold protein
MIRAVVQDGLLRPLDPLPLDWAEGHIVVVEDAESAISDDLDEWYEELNRLGPAQYAPGEREQIRAILAEADAQAKEFVRREMESL